MNYGKSYDSEVLETETTMIDWDQATITTKLTDKFVKAASNINDGYPILSWQNTSK